MNNLILRRTILFLLCFLSLMNASFAQDNQCRPILSPIDDDEFSYQIRKYGNSVRCEGFYRSPVSGNLEVVSFLVGELNYNLNYDVILEVSSPMHLNMNITAMAIPLGVFYRMGAELGKSSSLLWPLKDVIVPAGLYARLIGVFGWIKSGADKTYIPLRIRNTLNSNNQMLEDSTKIILTIRSVTDVTNINWRILSYYLNNRLVDLQQDWRRADINFAYAGDAIKIIIPNVYSGEIRIEIATQVINQNANDWSNLILTLLVPNLER